MKATRKQIQDLANAISGQAEGLAREIDAADVTDQEFHARAKLLQSNTATLVAWTETGE